MAGSRICDCDCNGDGDGDGAKKPTLRSAATSTDNVIIGKQTGTAFYMGNIG